MNVIETDLPEVLVLEPTVHGDDRGFFFEAWNQREFDRAVGDSVTFVQDNHSRSQAGVLRGLHYQIRHAQGKLIRVSAGTVYDVAVDLRRGSPHFGEWVGVELSSENQRQLWIPAGFAHGFYVVSEIGEVLYKATDYYASEWDRAIRWDDPELGIDWPLRGNKPILSAKDGAAPFLQQADVYE
jgi:dTDP-4-dehydrorhamnose 3,5-epimerase